MELAQPGEVTIRDLPALLDTLRAHDIYHRPHRRLQGSHPLKAPAGWSIRTPGRRGLWVDRAGNSWVSPWVRPGLGLQHPIAEEVARAGFDEIQFDYVRFPSSSATCRPQVHPAGAGRPDRRDRRLPERGARRLHPLGVTVTADVFGLSPNDLRRRGHRPAVGDHLAVRTTSSR
jgi:hypothetical protein